MNRWKAPVVGLLLEAGTETPPLHAAALTGDAGAAAALLSAGTDPKSRLGVVCALLEGGANPNRTAGPDTPLHFAAWVRTPEVVRALLNAGADPGIKGSKGYTPADRARGNRAVEESDVFERLRAGGSMPNSSLQRPIC